MPAPRSQTRSRILSTLGAGRIHGGDADIGALGKQRITFETWPERREIDRIGVSDKECRMRVTHIRADRTGEWAGGDIGAQCVRLTSQRDFAPVRARRTHIDRDAAILQQRGIKQPG